MRLQPYAIRLHMRRRLQPRATARLQPHVARARSHLSGSWPCIPDGSLVLTELDLRRISTRPPLASPSDFPPPSEMRPPPSDSTPPSESSAGLSQSERAEPVPSSAVGSTWLGSGLGLGLGLGLGFRVRV